MNITREQKKKITKKAILQAAVKLFGENGYENTSIEQLAKTAGIGKGTVYSYFSTKRDILYAFCEDELEFIHEQLAAKTNQDAPVLEQMTTIFMAEFEYVTRHPEFGRLFIQEMIFPKTLLSPQTRKESEDNYFEMIFPIIIRAQKKGEIRPELEPLHVCGHFFSLFLLLIHAYFTKMIPYDEAEQVLTTLFLQVLEGLQPSPHNLTQPR
jgi:AcrR family transcriptional regulator